MTVLERRASLPVRVVAVGLGAFPPSRLPPIYEPAFGSGQQMHLMARDLVVFHRQRASVVMAMGARTHLCWLPVVHGNETVSQLLVDVCPFRPCYGIETSPDIFSAAWFAVVPLSKFRQCEAAVVGVVEREARLMRTGES